MPFFPLNNRWVHMCMSMPYVPKGKGAIDHHRPTVLDMHANMFADNSVQVQQSQPSFSGNFNLHDQPQPHLNTAMPQVGRNQTNARSNGQNLAGNINTSLLQHNQTQLKHNMSP
jgi:hypothetical protein